MKDRTSKRQKEDKVVKQRILDRRVLSEQAAMKARFCNLAKTPAGREMIAHLIYISGSFKLEVIDGTSPPSGRDFGLLMLMKTNALQYQTDGNPTWDSLKELVDKILKD